MSNTKQIPQALRKHTPEVASFLLEVGQVCQKHGLSISHEDYQGAFTVVNFNHSARQWLWDARAVLKNKIQPSEELDQPTSEFEITNKLIWEDDSIQFPRLLCEINATQSELDLPALAESMDVGLEQLDELFERANVAWEKHKKTL